MLFVGFIEGLCAIKYYNAHTRQIGTTQNYYFTNTPPDTQFEGEEEPVDKPMGDQIELHENLKRKRPDDDPLLAYNPSPELTELANESLEEELWVYSPNKVVSTIDCANLALEDPQSLTEA